MTPRGWGMCRGTKFRSNMVIFTTPKKYIPSWDDHDDDGDDDDCVRLADVLHVWEGLKPTSSYPCWQGIDGQNIPMQLSLVCVLMQWW